MEYPERPSPSPPPSPIPDRPASPELPLTMMASVVLEALPQDASSALASAGEFDREKVVVRFVAVESAPQLKVQVRRITATQKFEAIVAYLRKVLRIGPPTACFSTSTAPLRPR
ncbi:Uu.00g036460.m01.CDS01 [Anthostomella pinea]|uniref:Ubiquitin-like protein ATG12 n=1 Tax=Anthostomella pinea TaxID=933095 RepID=A0AAI8YDP4_9PEZI|nr:Uu.00g036460.m01.CDS01 [Anthostomella pinea]